MLRSKGFGTTENCHNLHTQQVKKNSLMAQLENLSAELETLNQVLSLVEAFRAFDADNDGCITAAELGGIMGSLGYNASDQDVRAMMQQGDWLSLF